MANLLPSTNNSLTQFLTQLLRIQKNSMEIVGKLSEVTSSSAQSVYIQLEDATGATQSYELPSIGHIENEITRIDSNFNALAGLDGNDVTVRLPDGSYKKIIQSSLFKKPQDIGQLSIPTSFNQKNNWFFESFLNPLLYVSFDITNYIDYNTREVSYKRIIVNCDTDQKKQLFNSTYKGMNNISYDSLLTNLSKNNISYFVDEDVTSLPISIPKYSGSFDVIGFIDQTVPVTQTNGTILQTKVRKLQLNTLKYTDNLQNVKNSLILKPGDKLDVGQATIYKVVSVDTATNMVVLKMVSGTETIPVGVGVLNISVEGFSIKEVQINIGFGERQVIFIKAIDKDTNITSRDFSPGVGFYSNELLINQSGTQVSLATFYQQQVMDFGSALLSLVKEGTIPAIYGEVPDPPVLTASNFQVSLINSQKFDTTTINDLKKKIAQKNSIASEITQLQTAIDQKRQSLNTSKFNSDAERSAVQNQLNALIQQKTADSNLYASIVNDLSTTAKNLPPELSNAKHSIRGFFPFPSPKVSSTGQTLDQQVIGFVIAYRYLKNDGTAPGTTQIPFTDNNGETVQGYFSNWIETETKIRQKTYDSVLGIYTWTNENVQDANSVNVNQIDIPISKGEQVEIRVKSISEAGWPTNPLTSAWSSSIIISFPTNLTADEEVLASLSSSLAEQSRVNFNQDLTSKGLDLHLASSFVQKDNYYAHSTDSISSGFYDASGNLINLYDKIKSLDTQIAKLNAIINQAKGKLQISIVDPSGEKYLVANNSTIDLFAGYYSDMVSKLPSANQKGAIITALYQLVIENAAVSTLQLISSFPGGLDIGLPSSSTSTTVDADYKRSRKYDIVPLSLSSLHLDKTANGNSYQTSPFQSAQQLSQFIYGRYTDIGLKNTLYGSTGAGTIESNTLLPDFNSGTPSAFIWNGSYSTGVPQPNGPDSAFSVHILHPDINDGTGVTAYYPTGATNVAPAVYPKFVQSSYFNLQASDSDGKMQTQYIPTSLTGVTASKYPLKLGFYTNDRYLIGSNTCGSYLFLAPAGYADILVDGTDFRANRLLEYGEGNQIVIPIIYQYRMTDFFGSGANGNGRIGGFSAQPKNLVYTKKIGLDISVKDDTLFSFDIQVTSKYKVDSPSQTSISPAKNTKLAPAQTQLLTQIF